MGEHGCHVPCAAPSVSSVRRRLGPRAVGHAWTAVRVKVGSDRVAARGLVGLRCRRRRRRRRRCSVVVVGGMFGCRSRWPVQFQPSSIPLVQLSAPARVVSSGYIASCCPSARVVWRRYRAVLVFSFSDRDPELFWSWRCQRLVLSHATDNLGMDIASHQQKEGYDPELILPRLYRTYPGSGSSGIAV